MLDINRRILPGFGLSLGYTLLYMNLLVLIPIAVLAVKASQLSWSEFSEAVFNERALAAYQLTMGASFLAALINLVIGLLIAWVLVRYRFPGKQIFDALVDLPFALPTAVAGLVYSSLYVKRGWLGQFLVPLGIKDATMVTSGQTHSCALMEDGNVRCWGGNAHGELGAGDTEPHRYDAGEVVPAVKLFR